MLPRKNRFLFRGVFPKRVTHTPYMTIRFEKGEEMLKGAIVVSRKASKKATDRNRMKRILSDSLARYKDAPYSVVLFIRKNAFLCEEKELQSALRATLDSLLQ